MSLIIVFSIIMSLVSLVIFILTLLIGNGYSLSESEHHGLGLIQMISLAYFVVGVFLIIMFAVIETIIEFL